MRRAPRVEDVLATRLDSHLRNWLGAWPPTRPVDVVACELRGRPAWDGAIRPVVGVQTPAGTLLSVAPSYFELARDLADGEDDEGFFARLPTLLGEPSSRVGFGVFRAHTRMTDLPPAGTWVACDDGRLPAWLAVFPGSALVAFSADGKYVAGVGLKRHDELGVELAVGTEPHARNQGLGRRLVAQAARELFEAGCVATYLHAPHNFASGAVADAAGFPDRAWRVLSFREPT